MTNKFLTDSILSRRSNQNHPKKLGHVAFWGCLFIIFIFFPLFKQHLSHLPPLDSPLLTASSLKMLNVADASGTMNNNISNSINCTIGDLTDVCELGGDIRITSTSSSVFIVSSNQEISGNLSWKIKPYARKWEQTAMNRIREWTVKSVTGKKSSVPQCTRTHSTPAILFSIGGYAGNYFHSITDVIIPLFLTARKFNGDVKFLVTNRSPYWMVKFQKLLENLSKYESIDIDKEKDVHCFRNVIVGLQRHKSELKIDPSKSPYTMEDFRAFLRKSYSLKKVSAIKIRNGVKKMPQLLIISRKKTRAFLNIEDIARDARRLGFNVVVSELGSNASMSAEIVNSCDVMMGVHGSGLTNMVFLPENAILINVVPIGNFKWLAKNHYKEPAKGMNLRYLEYKIKKEESSLSKEFPPGHEVLSNPDSIAKQGWLAFKAVYLNKQNLEIDMERFRHTLLKALELLRE